MLKFSWDVDRKLFIVWPALLTVGLLVGCWWWLRGYTVLRDPARGWRRWAGVAARSAVLAAAFWVLGLPGDVRWWGFAVVVLCGAWGWLAFLRLLAEARQEPRPGQAVAAAPAEQAPSELAAQMRRLVLQRRARGLRP
ncbi:hypothetical protein [Micromonospora costi]|uniref:Uncharacterized protein n=1 Tax=Micromonospora costi TaxID=1530042 RepID=A0A3B0A6L7_9ACTN|nr:hypothetical protein [Micromonospora costi]RKN56013.1 hypothetical protein D7193_15625 [Micromonospora costi]